jgi:hypothetical protein
VSNYSLPAFRAVLLLGCLNPAAYAGSPLPAAPVAPNAPTPIIVIGFLGGFVRHDAVAHSTVQVMAHLRHDYPSGVYADVVENHQRAKAHAQIVRLMDVDRDGSLSPEEKKNARIILYGHSWGASEAVTLARELETEGIPVLLTVQVDSVSKRGENDHEIPANVAEAANFYQLDGFLHGQSQIRASDPKRTHIIGNFRYDYRAHPIDCKQYPWYDRLFMRSHIEIECDPKVWGQVETMVETMIDSRIPESSRAAGEPSKP